MLLDNDPFLSELTRMFERSKSSGSVVLTMKRYDGRTKPQPRSGKVAEPNEYKCLIRASSGNKKISTVINHKDVTKFQMVSGFSKGHPLKYCLLCKNSRKHVGKDVEISKTDSEIDAAYQKAYGNLLRAKMDGLKRKDKKRTSPRKKAKAT